MSIRIRYYYKKKTKKYIHFAGRCYNIIIHLPIYFIYLNLFLDNGQTFYGDSVASLGGCLIYYRNLNAVPNPLTVFMLDSALKS